MAKKKIRIFYRAPSHVPVWKIMQEAGFMEKHGLEMEMGSLVDKRTRATEGLLTGDFDVVSGNHHSLYARRALKGDPFVHIAQAASEWNQRWMIAGKGVNSVADLKGKRVVMDRLDAHMALNVWLFLTKNGLIDGQNVSLVEGDRKPLERARHVMAGAFDATFMGRTEAERAKKLGANVIEMPRMPMIEGLTATTTTTFVNSHPEEVDGLLKAMVDAIHFFKTRKKDTIDLLNRTCRNILKFQSDEELDEFYDERSKEMQAKPYPSIDAIQNVFQLGVKCVPEIKDFNPLIMWDMHYLRAIDDSGYIDNLYKSGPVANAA